jgi:IS605 OrfB family transposase
VSAILSLYGWKFRTLDKLQEDQLVYKDYQNLQNHINELWTFRERVVKNIIHSVSSKISQICNYHNGSILVLGKNQNMKQDMEGKVWNQFPHSRMMKLLGYKLEDIGTKLVEQDESYTSMSSYFELEPFEHNFAYTGARRNEWFYRKNKKRYDADVHASLNIIRKYLETEVGDRYVFPVGEPRIPLSKQFFVHCFVRA